MTKALFYWAIRRNHILLLILYVGVSSFAATAENNHQTMSLSRAIELTLAQNPQLHPFSVKREGLIGLRESNDLPQPLNLSIETENVAGSDEASAFSSAETTVALSSVIELGSKRKARVSVANARLSTLDYQKQAFTLDVLAELTGVFVQTLEIQERLKIVAEARELSQNVLHIVGNRAQQGAAAESEAERAAAALAQVELQADALQRHHERNRMKLASYWGDTSPQWRRIEGDLYALGKQANFSELYQRALSSPAIEVFASDTRLANAELQLAKSQSALDVSWQVGVRQSEETGRVAFTAGMSIPLFSRKRNHGNIAAAIAQKTQIKYQQQSATLRLHTQLYEAYSQREQYLYSTHTYQTIIIPKLTSALISTQSAYESGRYSYQDWMAAQQELLKAKQALVESATATALSQALIEQLIAEPLNH